MASKAHRPATARSPGRLALALCWSVWALLAAGPASAAEPGESLRGPDVTIIADERRTIYEFRQNGELRMVRIVPELGKPYYLVPSDPSRGFGDLERAEMLLPSWVIVEF